MQNEWHGQVELERLLQDHEPEPFYALADEHQKTFTNLCYLLQRQVNHHGIVSSTR